MRAPPLLSIVFARVNVEHNPLLEEYFGIDGYPTLLLFRDGAKEKEFKGLHLTESMVSYLQRELSPPSSTVASMAELKEIVESSESEAFVLMRYDNDLTLTLTLAPSP